MRGASVVLLSTAIAMCSSDDDVEKAWENVPEESYLECSCSESNNGAMGYPWSCEHSPSCDLPSPCPSVRLEDFGWYEDEPPTFSNVDAARCVAEALRDRTPGRYSLGVTKYITLGESEDVLVLQDGYAFGSSRSYNDQFETRTVWGRHRLGSPAHFASCLDHEDDHEQMMRCLRSWRGPCEPGPATGCTSPD